MRRTGMFRFFRHTPVIAGVLTLSVAVILCVILTAAGSLIRLNLFYSDTGNSIYAVQAPEGARASVLSELAGDSSVRANIIFISPADTQSGGVAVGISQTQDQLPGYYVEAHEGADQVLKDVSGMRGQALLSMYCSNLYNTIYPPRETVNIEGVPFEPAGVADYYFTYTEFEQIDAISQPGDMEIGIPPVTDGMNGVEAEYPESMVSVLISAHDFTKMDLPLAVCKVVFPSPPSASEHRALAERFQEAGLTMEAWQTGSQSINFSHINGGVCALAMAAALILMGGMVNYLLDACAGDMRVMFIVGCGRGRIFRNVLGKLALLYLLALALSAYPCRWVLNWMGETNLSIMVSAGNQMVLSLAGYVLIVLMSVPAVWRAVRKYTREDGRYVQAY